MWNSCPAYYALGNSSFNNCLLEQNNTNTNCWQVISNLFNNLAALISAAWALFSLRLSALRSGVFSITLRFRLRAMGGNQLHKGRMNANIKSWHWLHFFDEFFKNSHNTPGVSCLSLDCSRDKRLDWICASL